VPDGEQERVAAKRRESSTHPSLHDVQQFTQEIIDCAAERIFVCDRELRYQVWNRFMEQLTGRRAEEALGKSAVDLFPSLRENAMEVALSRALQGEVVQIPDVFVRMPRTDRDVWESCTFAPHRDSEGNIVGVIGMVRDVTERHIAEETFRLIVVGTAASTGTDFFQTLVRHMAAALRARYAFLTDCDDQKHARLLAFWKGDGFGENFEFDTAATPCEKVLHGEVCQYQQGLQGLFPLDKLLADWNAESYLGVPMLDRSDRVIGHIAILDDKPMDADSRAIGLVKIFASRAAAELKRQKAEDGLQAALQEVQRLKDQLYRENLALRDEVDRVSMFEEIVGSSKPLKVVLSRIDKVAPTDSTVCITGETGTGKELIARAVHMRSHRSDRAFVSVNCAALAPSLISSELFGHEKGAFTGATQRKLGRFELADGGTIFLDEVGELLPETQAALLRVLQEREFERVGGTQPIRVDVRVIAATNRDLKAATTTGTFRQDLFYRLNVFPIEVPSLRERKDDLLMLVEYFVQRYAGRAGKNIRSIDKKTLDLLLSYDWPGNIRELQNVIERSVILSAGDVFSIDELWLSRESIPAVARIQSVAPSQGESPSEREIIEAALAESKGRVSGPSGAAARLKIPASTLAHRIKALNINKSQFKFG
jgi:PAS domain S-box-containing protein